MPETKNKQTDVTNKPWITDTSLTDFSNEETIYIEDQQENRKLDKHYKPIRPNRHVKTFHPTRVEYRFFLSEHRLGQPNKPW